MKRFLGVVLMAAAATAVVSCDRGKSDDKKSSKDKDKGDKDGDRAKDKDKASDAKGAAGFSSAQHLNEGPGGTPEAESYLADTGFRPGRDGLSWQNGDRDDQGNPVSFPETSRGHLDDDGVERLFGSERVCLGGSKDCTLTPAAAEFRDMVNKSMNGGMCEGMAVFGLSLYKGLDKPASFKDGAASAAELERDQSRAPVGYYFAYQFLDPFRSYWQSTMARTTPNEVLENIVSSMQEKKDPVVLEFFAPPPQRGGHAVVPYAVEDRGNGVFWVRVWDNNWPGVSRYIEIDKNKNSWRYALAAVNPSEEAQAWYGDASRNTIVATPLDQRMSDATCHFCRDSTVGSSMIFITGGGRALLSDAAGHKVGYDNGTFVNDMPGAIAFPPFAYVPGQPEPHPVLIVPSHVEYDIQITGQESGQVDVGVFSAGAALIVNDIDTLQGEKDKLELAADGFGLSYEPASAGHKPHVKLAVDSAAHDFLLDLADLTAKAGEELEFDIDPAKLELSVKEAGQILSDFDISVTRYESDGETKTFSKSDIPEEHSFAAGDGTLDFGDL